MDFFRQPENCLKNELTKKAIILKETMFIEQYAKKAWQPETYWFDESHEKGCLNGGFQTAFLGFICLIWE